jgi:hypothetical protein
MITLIEDNKKHGYRIYNSSVIVDHYEELLSIASVAHQRCLENLNVDNTTSAYNRYNSFTLFGCDKHYYNLYKDLIYVIKDFVPKTECMWFESWINWWTPKEVLGWHDHLFKYHGYISIDPKSTFTKFRKYSIENKIGNIYIGPGFREHRVIVDTKYDGPRLTMGFDINVEPTKTDNLSFIPII